MSRAGPRPQPRPGDRTTPQRTGPRPTARPRKQDHAHSHAPLTGPRPQPHPVDKTAPQRTGPYPQPCPADRPRGQDHTPQPRPVDRTTPRGQDHTPRQPRLCGLCDWDRYPLRTKFPVAETFDDGCLLRTFRAERWPNAVSVRLQAFTAATVLRPSVSIIASRHMIKTCRG